MVKVAPTWAMVTAIAVLHACGGTSQGDGGDDSGGEPSSGGVAGAASGGTASASGGVAGASGMSGGVAGAGGASNSMCPAVLGMDCEVDGVSCLYDAWTQCLCTEPMRDANGLAFDCKVVDTRCPSGPIAGSTHGPMGNMPIACVCVNGTLSCE
jgi:hypothetical protein